MKTVYWTYIPCSCTVNAIEDIEWWLVSINKHQKYAKIWINIIKFLVEYSVSEPINFCPLSTETFVDIKTFRTKQVAYFDESNRNSSLITPFLKAWFCLFLSLSLSTF